MQTTIYLVRHGEPQLTGTLLGMTNSPLSDKGWQQLRVQCQSLKKVNQVLSSPLDRCAHFATYFARENNIALDIDHHWQECNFGDWDGVAYDVLHKNFNPHATQFFTDPAKYPPPNGESLHDFYERSCSAVKTLIEQHQGKTVLVFTHGGVIRNLVAWCLGLDYLSGNQFQRFAVEYASITQLTIFHEPSLFAQLQHLNITGDNVKTLAEPVS